MFYKIITIININLILLIILPFNALALKNEKLFLVTAYYSPLPNQKYFSTWNYEDEIKLNWWWVVWASWKPVFNWMLAWPKEYKFWTKINFEWIWVWVIEDRWWAIVSNFSWTTDDRIDIWTWFGYEWLQKAISIWKKKIKWTIVENNTEIWLDLDKLSWKKKIEKENKITIENTWSWKIISNTWTLNEKKDFDFNYELNTQENIKKVQTILKNLNYLNWNIDWNYNNLKKTILDYQLSKNLIKSKNDVWAWVFWPKTKENLKSEYLWFLENEQIKKEIQSKINEFEKLSEEKALEKITLIWNPHFWETSKEVRELQNGLKKLWYFEYKDTAIFWESTKNSLIYYQLDKKLIKSKKDLWAWTFWEKTKQQLKKDFENKFFNEFIKNENLENKMLIFKKITKNWTAP